MKFYSVHKCRKILRAGHKIFLKKKECLSEMQKRIFEADLRSLDQALLTKRKEDAVESAKKIEKFLKTNFPKTPFDHLLEIVFALVFAIVVAFLIRQFWFELYEVPTGSMRPTIEEQDRMVVSKTTFGINSPFRMKPLLFSEDYIKRAGIVVFTVANMDISDSDTLYFYLFPGKKRYVKRNVSKPGDTIYFYGGRIYSIDKKDQAVTELFDETFLKENGIEKIDHVPYISMDGKMKVFDLLAHNFYSSVKLFQMNQPLAKMEFLPEKRVIEGKFFNGKEWVEDHPEALKARRDHPVSYSDLWGIGNYAMARLLTKDEALSFYEEVPSDSEDTLLYLELKHTPNLAYPKPEIRKDEMGRYHPMITPMSALIPMKQSHLDAIQNAMITARFIVKDGKAYRYYEGRKRPQPADFDPSFPNVPNGSYEIYYGKAYKVHFSGVRTELPRSHPLYSSSAENIYKLFNLGIHFNLVFEPAALNQSYLPQRFAYYRDGDLYLMGAPILKKSDPVLIRFNQEQLEKQESSSRDKPYIAFIDRGPPLKDGKVDIEFIKAFGLKVPENGIVALGDNFAMSADSRDFGFVPVENLRGSPSFTFWPPSSRFGPLAQPPYPWFTLPNLIVWSGAVMILAVVYFYAKRRNEKSVFKD